MLERTEFKRDEKRNIFVDYDSLNEKKESLNDFVSNEPLLNKSKFSKTDFPQEIKFNNAIEGIDDDVSDIEKVLSRSFMPVNRDRTRIMNLYKGYKYILQHKEINKDNLRELYGLLSNSLLKPEDSKRMGEYYRLDPVYILRGVRFDRYFTGVESEHIDEYMNILFDYINRNNDNTDIDTFIKSQIIHCYLVYIHPYFDVNGRTSRTLAMWYLFNKKDLSYITFNRSISFMKSKYEKSLIELREKGNMTPFLHYMLDAERLELEKEYIINNIEKNIGKKLTNEEYLTLEYLLSLNGRLTLLDLISMYNDFNAKKKKHIVLQDEINPLIEKGIIKTTIETKHHIVDGIKNKRIVLNNDMLDVDTKKIKLLKLDKYIKENQD